jgi:hypothetical protein
VIQIVNDLGGGWVIMITVTTELRARSFLPQGQHVAQRCQAHVRRHCFKPTTAGGEQGGEGLSSSIFLPPLEQPDRELFRSPRLPRSVRDNRITTQAAIPNQQNSKSASSSSSHSWFSFHAKDHRPGRDDGPFVLPYQLSYHRSTGEGLLSRSIQQHAVKSSNIQHLASPPVFGEPPSLEDNDDGNNPSSKNSPSIAATRKHMTEGSETHHWQCLLKRQQQPMAFLSKDCQFALEKLQRQRLDRSITQHNDDDDDDSSTIMVLLLLIGITLGLLILCSPVELWPWEVECETAQYSRKETEEEEKNCRVKLVAYEGIVPVLVV